MVSFVKNTDSIRLVAGSILLLLSAQTFSSTWSCRNQDMEIHCNSNKCELSDGFTPFDIVVSDDGALSICAYSGCWKGKGRAMKSGNHLLVSGTKLTWIGTNPGSADFIVAVDASDNIGFVKGEGFAMPITCTQR